LKRFPSLQADIANAANESLERFREESRRTVMRLVDMESSYLTVEFFRKLHLEPEKTPNSNPNAPNAADRYSDNNFRRIGMWSYSIVTEQGNCCASTHERFSKHTILASELCQSLPFSLSSSLLMDKCSMVSPYVMLNIA